jgi:peptidyl-prolyl cis-trans isomerase B (cyclophilin B)
MAERASTARRRRRQFAIIGSAVAAVVAVVLVIWAVVATTGGKKGTPSANASASASTSAAPTRCAWKPNPDPSASPASPAAQANPHIKNVGTPPASGEPRSGTRDMTIDTSLGKIVIQLDLAHAPCTSASFTYLAEKHFFDNSSCHRLVNSAGTNPQDGSATDFHVLQCGDPSGTGQGGPAYQFDDENLPTDQRPSYPAGSVAMANSGANTNGSQFFIVFGDTLLPASYTIFGHVTGGLDIAKQVGAAGDDGAFAGSGGPGGGHPKKAVTFKSVTVGPVQNPSPAP